MFSGSVSMWGQGSFEERYKACMKGERPEKQPEAAAGRRVPSLDEASKFCKAEAEQRWRGRIPQELVARCDLPDVSDKTRCYETADVLFFEGPGDLDYRAIVAHYPRKEEREKIAGWESLVDSYGLINSHSNWRHNWFGTVIKKPPYKVAEEIRSTLAAELYYATLNAEHHPVPQYSDKLVADIRSIWLFFPSAFLDDKEMFKLEFTPPVVYDDGQTVWKLKNVGGWADVWNAQCGRRPGLDQEICKWAADNANHGGVASAQSKNAGSNGSSLGSQPPPSGCRTLPQVRFDCSKKSTNRYGCVEEGVKAERAKGCKL